MGVDGFIRDMTELGFEATLETELVVYRIVPIDGAHAGTRIETGVAVAELQSWPQVPPHWLHFPSTLKFSRTNEGSSPRPDWSSHSRQISGWGDAPAGIAWASHVRAVLSEAVV